MENLSSTLSESFFFVFVPSSILGSLPKAVKEFLYRVAQGPLV